MFNEVNAFMSKSTHGVAADVGGEHHLSDGADQLPTVFDIQSVSSGANIASAQLAMQYCQALVADPTLGPAFFPGFNFTAAPCTAFASHSGMDLMVQPLINNLIGPTIWRRSRLRRRSVPSSTA